MHLRATLPVLLAARDAPQPRVNEQEGRCPLASVECHEFIVHERQLRWQQLQRIEIDAKVNRISLDLFRNIVATDLATHRGGSSPSFEGQAYAPAASAFA